MSQQKLTLAQQRTPTGCPTLEDTSFFQHSACRRRLPYPTSRPGQTEHVEQSHRARMWERYPPAPGNPLDSGNEGNWPPAMSHLSRDAEKHHDSKQEWMQQERAEDCCLWWCQPIYISRYAGPVVSHHCRIRASITSNNNKIISLPALPAGTRLGQLFLLLVLFCVTLFGRGINSICGSVMWLSQGVIQKWRQSALPFVWRQSSSLFGLAAQSRGLS